MITEAQLNVMFALLQQKIAQLQAHSDELSGAVRQFETEKIALLNTIKEQREKIRELQKKPGSHREIFTLPTKNGNVVKDNQAGAADNTELKQKLDEYIGEIEQLIAHLSTLS
jgi:predicted nuclease with TOPRIM domain